ncbi:MAG: polysaccharide biosynthesis tyrosine autokinase [Planctomycetota bacterium]
MTQQIYEHENSLHEYLEIVRKRVWLLILVFVLTVTVVAIVSYRMKPVYRSKALLHIERKTPNIVAIQDVYQMEVKLDQYYETQYKLIKSKRACRAVFERLDLSKSAKYFGVEDPVSSFSKDIIVEPVTDTYLVNVVYESESPELAAKVANAIADEYITAVKREKRTISEGAENRIMEQIPVLRKKLQNSQSALQKFEEENSALSFEKRRSIIYEALSSLNSQLISVQQELARIQTKQESVINAKTADEILSIPAVMSNAAIQAYSRDKIALVTQKTDLIRKYRTDSEPVKTIEAKIEIIDEKIRSEAKKVAESIGLEVQEKESEKNKLEALIEEQSEAAKYYDANMSKYDSLCAEVEGNRKLYEEFVQRQKEIQSSSQFDVNTVNIIDRAEVPREPASPNRRLNVLLAAVFSILGGLGLIFLFEHLDDSIKNQEDMEKYVKVPILGVVPSAKRNKKESLEIDLIAHLKPKADVSEAYRSIRTGLLYTSPDKEHKAYVVTSAGPREGKTMTAINIAITMAHTGKKVLLVDSDMRKPRVHKTFKIDNSKGFSNYLVGQKSPEEVIVKSEIDNLYVLSSGPIPPNPAELLDSPKFVEFITNMKKDFDLIIFDSPPLIAITDGAVMAAKTDGAIQVIWAGNTSRKIAEMGKDRIESIGAKVLGAILNNVRISKSGYYYYYHRYYNYYYGSGEKHSKSNELNT